MTDPNHASAGGVLGPVRELEEALAEVSKTRAASDARLEAARADAARLLDAAQDAAAVAVAERRRTVLGAAEDDATRISRQGDERAARVLADARAGMDAEVEAALALILPAAGDGDGEA
jgi:vacuolar-type H+-ATPase subunit H